MINDFKRGKGKRIRKLLDYFSNGETVPAGTKPFQDRSSKVKTNRKRGPLKASANIARTPPSSLARRRPRHDKDEFATANRRGADQLRTMPIATGARYDRNTDRVVVGLSSGIEVAFRPRNAQGIEHAKPHQLNKIEISPLGLGLHFPKLDADIYLPALLEGFLGFRRWLAAELGRNGGKAKSKAKSAASRRNGKLGGRRKSVKENPRVAARPK